MRLLCSSTRAFRCVKETLISIQAWLTHEQEINIQNMNVELVAQMFKNYQSNVLFHLEGVYLLFQCRINLTGDAATDSLKEPS